MRNLKTTAPESKSSIENMSIDIKKKIEDLSRKLEEHNYKYYVLSEPTISDYEFDNLLEELILLEKAHPEYLK